MFRMKKKTRKTTCTKKRQQRCLAKQNKIYRKLTINNIESACALLFFFSFLWSFGCFFFLSLDIFVSNLCDVRVEKPLSWCGKNDSQSTRAAASRAPSKPSKPLFLMFSTIDDLYNACYSLQDHRKV